MGDHPRRAQGPVRRDPHRQSARGPGDRRHRHDPAGRLPDLHLPRGLQQEGLHPQRGPPDQREQDHAPEHRS